MLGFVPSQATVTPCFRVEGVYLSMLLELHKEIFLSGFVCPVLNTVQECHDVVKKVNVIFRCKTTYSLLRISKALEKCLQFGALHFKTAVNFG